MITTRSALPSSLLGFSFVLLASFIAIDSTSRILPLASSPTRLHSIIAMVDPTSPIPQPPPPPPNTVAAVTDPTSPVPQPPPPPPNTVAAVTDPTSPVPQPPPPPPAV